MPASSLGLCSPPGSHGTGHSSGRCYYEGGGHTLMASTSTLPCLPSKATQATLTCSWRNTRFPANPSALRRDRAAVFTFPLQGSNISPGSPKFGDGWLCRAVSLHFTAPVELDEDKAPNFEPTIQLGFAQMQLQSALVQICPAYQNSPLQICPLGSYSKRGWKTLCGDSFFL